MVDMTAIMGAFTSLKAAREFVQAAIDVRDGVMTQGEVFKLQSIIMDAQERVFSANEERATLIERVRELEKQITQFETWDAEKQKYELKQVHRGAFAYVLKPTPENTEPPHWICAACYQRGKKAILQDLTEKHARDHSWVCPDCKTRLLAPYDVSPGGEQ